GGSNLELPVLITAVAAPVRISRDVDDRLKKTWRLRVRKERLIGAIAHAEHSQAGRVNRRQPSHECRRGLDIIERLGAPRADLRLAKGPAVACASALVEQ